MNDADSLLAQSVAARVAGDHERARELASEHLARAPHDPDGHVALAAAFAAGQRFEEAAEWFESAHRLAPERLEILNLLAVAHCDAGNIQTALGCVWTLLDRAREIPEIRANLAIILLKSGALRAGFLEYQWRFGTLGSRDLIDRFSAPLWRGERISGLRMFLHAEQGLGDTLQFLRYVPLVTGLGAAAVTLEVQPPLVRLARAFAEPLGCAVIADGDPVPPIDVHCPLLSLPAMFGTEMETIPFAAGYVAADPALAALWRGRLEAKTRPGARRVGLVWAGGARPNNPVAAAMDRRRSVPPSDLGLLGAVPGIDFVSLQLGRADQPAPDLPLIDLTSGIKDFADTAALVDSLDLVVSVDTSVAHLAGAMGKPVWILSRFDNCWRWFVDREDSPWYARARLFRQPRPGDWEPVLRAVALALEEGW